ncbi:MAG TPA: DUF721 domain-containing protein [Gemmatimonadales bacterium]|nr:DUF721 domain-containing protein [Gemmatimonadales bacterium]
MSEVLRGYLEGAGLSERVGQADVVARWAELVGPGIARHANAELVTPDGVLFVRVKSAAWRQELSLMTPDLLARLNAGRTTGRIEQIRWVLSGGGAR